MAKTQQTWSLKEIDQERQATKGTAFLAFKQLKESFDEGRDFYYLHASEDIDEIEALRAGDRIYASTVNAILLTETGHAALVDYLDG